MVRFLWGLCFGLLGLNSYAQSSITFLCENMAKEKLELKFGDAKEGNRLLKFVSHSEDKTGSVVQYVFEVAIPDIRFSSIVKSISNTSEGKVYSVVTLSAFPMAQKKLRYMVEEEQYLMGLRPVLLHRTYYHCGRVVATDDFQVHPLWDGKEVLRQVLEGY